MNRLSLRQTIQSIVAGAMVLIGSFALFHGAGVLMAIPAEPGGCADNTCKDIPYWLVCNADKTVGPGSLFDRLDCFYCAQAKGRCESGTKGKCGDTETPLKIAAADVAENCECANAAAGGAVEGTLVKQTGDLEDAGRKQKTCK